MPPLDYSEQDCDFNRRFRAAVGYCELGMWDDAWRELEEIAPEQRHFLEVLKLRVHILNALKKWDAAATLAESLIAKGIENGSLYLDAAYAVRRARSLSEANTLLLRGERLLEDEPMFHFNLACYACLLGDLTRAKQRLSRAIELDKKLDVTALDDEDLKELWDSLAGTLEA